MLQQHKDVNDPLSALSRICDQPCVPNTPTTPQGLPPDCASPAQENLEEMRAATPRAQRLSEKVYGRHANERVELLRAALRSPLCQPSMLPSGPGFTFHPATNPRRPLTCPEASPARCAGALPCGPCPLDLMLPPPVWHHCPQGGCVSAASTLCIVR